MDTTLTSDRFDRWAQATGPARLLLLAPLREELLRPPDPPNNVELVIEPVRWLLEQMIAKRVTLTKGGLLRARFAEPANGELGWDTPPRMPNGERTHLEIESLHACCRKSGLSRRNGRRELITKRGRSLIDDPVRLWRWIADHMGRLPEPLGVVTELRLAAVLRAEHADAVTEASRIANAFCEIFEEPSPEHQDLAVYWLERTLLTMITLGRALSMWQKTSDPLGRLYLTAAGRATALSALRSSALNFEDAYRAPGWN